MTNGSDDTIVSYVTLRRVVGVLGMGLPLVVALWGFAIRTPPSLQDSISAYYDLRTRDAFVGILFTIAWFLFTYRGPERKDDIAGNFACVFALIVALFPTNGAPYEHLVHLTAATGLFLVLAYFSLFLFTKSAPTPTPEKLRRNQVYRTCGWIMVACIGLIALFNVFGRGTAIATWKPVFWLESLALWAFGISWLVKGETIWRDAPRA